MRIGLKFPITALQWDRQKSFLTMIVQTEAELLYYKTVLVFVMGWVCKVEKLSKYN